MTLSLMLATPQYVLQATDRLVSDTATGRPFDHVSNKNVVYQARDAILTIAYSGTAYINGRPTDQWIAELLTGETFFEDGGRWTLRSGEMRQWLDAGTCVARLRESIKQARVASRQMPFTVIVAGWQWKKDRLRARPVLSTLEYDGRIMDEDRVPRRWHLVPWPRSRQPIFPCSSDVYLAPHVLGWIPGSNLHEALAVQTKRRLQGCLYSPRAALDEMVRAIRRRSREVSGIGEDCLGICLPHPANPRVQIVYRPARDYESLSLAGVSVGSPDYSPWIVGRNNVQAPSLIVGNAGGFCLDDFAVEQFIRPFHPKTVGGRRILSGQTHQRRRPAPRTP